MFDQQWPLCFGFICDANRAYNDGVLWNLLNMSRHLPVCHKMLLYQNIFVLKTLSWVYLVFLHCNTYCFWMLIYNLSLHIFVWCQWIDSLSILCWPEGRWGLIIMSFLFVRLSISVLPSLRLSITIHPAQRCFYPGGWPRQTLILPKLCNLIIMQHSYYEKDSITFYCNLII